MCLSILSEDIIQKLKEMCGKETGKGKNPKIREERLHRFYNKCLGSVDEELEYVKKDFLKV